VEHGFEQDQSVPKWHGWHALRRGLATNLREAGADMKDIQSILGRADESTTAKHYAKQRDKRKFETIQLLNDGDDATVQ
jgi:site-specific recombinase XerD